MAYRNKVNPTLSSSRLTLFNDKSVSVSMFSKLFKLLYNLQKLNFYLIELGIVLLVYLSGENLYSCKIRLLYSQVELSIIAKPLNTYILQLPKIGLYVQCISHINYILNDYIYRTYYYDKQIIVQQHSDNTDVLKDGLTIVRGRNNNYILFKLHDIHIKSHKNVNQIIITDKDIKPVKTSNSNIYFKEVIYLNSNGIYHLSDNTVLNSSKNIVLKSNTIDLLSNNMLINAKKYLCLSNTVLYKCNTFNIKGNKIYLSGKTLPLVLGNKLLMILILIITHLATHVHTVIPTLPGIPVSSTPAMTASVITGINAKIPLMKSMTSFTK